MNISNEEYQKLKKENEILIKYLNTEEHNYVSLKDSFKRLKDYVKEKVTTNRLNIESLDARLSNVEVNVDNVAHALACAENRLDASENDGLVVDSALGACIAGGVLTATEHLLDTSDDSLTGWVAAGGASCGCLAIARKYGRKLYRFFRG